MGYVDELLSAHAALAAELEAEPEEALARHAARRRGQTREEQEKPENDARGVPAEETPETGAERTEERGAAALLQELLWLEQTGARASLRAAQLRSEQALEGAQQTQGVQPSVMRHSRFEGGLCADFSQSLETQGVSGAQTQRSMREISRFFERDARRYGG